MFLHPVRSVYHVVHSSASVVQNIDALFFILGGTCTDSTKCTLGHVTSNFCFCMQWDLWVT
jgi:hypothetical protein